MIDNSIVVGVNPLAHLKDGAIDFVAGTAGGVAIVYSGQPLDTVKVKMQAFPTLNRNWLSCFGNIMRTGGIKGLYAGSIPALVANVSENAVLFTSYGFCQKAVGYASGSNTTGPLGNATAGALAAFFAAIVLCPTELVKCRLQAQSEVNSKLVKTPASICREMFQEGGIRSFYTGFVATLIREVPGYFCFFGAYEMSRRFLTPIGKTKEEIGVLRTAISGGIGGMALWTAIFPADVVKSRMQIGETGRFSTILLKIVKNEGISALYKGLSPTLIRTCIASAALFITFENIKTFLHSL
uniref:Mitochondrial carrier protein n=2 Tax=Meloidogyne incognita group TaxID=654580 RepID=A0A914LAQ6_MELIC